MCIVSPAGDATGAEKGLLEVMSGVLNYLRKEQMELQYLLGKALPLTHLLHISRGCDLYSAAAEEKESYCVGSCCPVIEY